MKRRLRSLHCKFRSIMIYLLFTSHELLLVRIGQTERQEWAVAGSERKHTQLKPPEGKMGCCSSTISNVCVHVPSWVGQRTRLNFTALWLTLDAWAPTSHFIIFLIYFFPGYPKIFICKANIYLFVCFLFLHVAVCHDFKTRQCIINCFTQSFKMYYYNNICLKIFK